MSILEVSSAETFEHWHQEEKVYLNTVHKDISVEEVLKMDYVELLGKLKDTQ